jgi:hypothetical protein
VTTQQIFLFSGLYLLLSVVVAFFTRANARRIAGAVAGAAASGLVALGVVALGERVGWWHMAIAWEPFSLTLMMIGITVCFFLFLLTWRIARRFGWRGLAVFLVFAAIIGPPRDYWYMRHFPEWGSYAPGIAPVLAISATYVLLILVGHGVMRLIAGPACGDALARHPWEPA